MLCQFTKLNFPTFPHSLKKKQGERLDWRSTKLTKKEAGQTDEIFPSPRNKSFQNSNCNRRTCFFLSEFRASPIPDLENFPTFLHSLKKKQVERLDWRSTKLTKKEAGQTDEIFPSPRNKSFQNSNCNRRTCFFLSEFRASPIPDLENFPTFLHSLKKKQVERTEFF